MAPGESVTGNSRRPPAVTPQTEFYWTSGADGKLRIQECLSCAARDWPADFSRLAARIRVPVRFSYAEYEQVWRPDPEALSEITGFFTASPRFVRHRQPGTGHNVSVSFAAESYHRSLFSFVEDCVHTASAGDRRAGEPAP